MAEKRSERCTCLSKLRPGWGLLSDLDSQRGLTRRYSTEHWAARPNAYRDKCPACTRPGWGTLDDLDDSADSTDLHLPSDLAEIGQPLPDLHARSTSDVFGSRGLRQRYTFSDDTARSPTRCASDFVLPDLHNETLMMETEEPWYWSSNGLSWMPHTRRPRNKPRSKLPKRAKYFEGADDGGDCTDSNNDSAGNTSLGGADDLADIIDVEFPVDPVVRSRPLHSAATIFTNAILGVSGHGDDLTELRLRFRIANPTLARIHATLNLPSAINLHSISVNGGAPVAIREQEM